MRWRGKHNSLRKAIHDTSVRCRRAYSVPHAEDVEKHYRFDRLTNIVWEDSPSVNSWNYKGLNMYHNIL